MKITPLDIRKQEFKKTMRGYDPVEVDTFMEMAAKEFEELLREMKEIRDRNIELETQLKDYKQIEKTLQQTLLQAQEVTGKTYESARREAEAIVREAEGKAARIVEQANNDLAKLNDALAQLHARRESLIGRLRILLSSELELLKTLDMGGETGIEPSASLGSGKAQLDTERIIANVDINRTA